jgi:hypothetical protein
MSYATIALMKEKPVRPNLCDLGQRAGRFAEINPLNICVLIGG